MMVLQRGTGSSAGTVNVITGIPRMPIPGNTLPGHSNIFYFDIPVYVTTMGRRLMFQDASNGGANGSYLYGQDGMIALTELNAERLTVASGGYSGCLFRVVRTRSGTFICMHIYNPGQNPQLLADADRYVTAQGYTEIATLPSAGRINGGGFGQRRVDAVWFICELASNDRVAISRLLTDSTGGVVSQDSGVFPGVNFDLPSIS